MARFLGRFQGLRISRLAIAASVLLGGSSILVYGVSAVIVGAGLIGALRGH